MLTSFILLLPCIVSLCTAVLLFINRKENQRPQKIWMWCMALMTWFFFVFAYYYNGIEDYSLYYKLDSINVALGAMFLPFVRLYFKTLTDDAPLGWKEYSWFFPGLFLGVSSIVLYTWMGDARAASYLQSLAEDYRDMGEFSAPVFKIHYVISFVFYYITVFTQIIWITICNIRSFRNYRKKLDDFLTSPDVKSLHNINAIIKGVFMILILSMVSITEVYFFDQEYMLLIYIYVIAFAALLFYINYHIWQVRYTAETLKENLLQLDKEEKEQGYLTTEEPEIVTSSAPVIKKNRCEEITRSIVSLLDEDKIYLKKDLRMDDIVRLTQVNRTYIAIIINDTYHCSFSEVVNRKRIAHAQQLALNNQSLSHTQIAEQSGFSHASSFSRTFKQYVGVTFREWYSAAVR